MISQAKIATTLFKHLELLSDESISKLFELVKDETKSAEIDTPIFKLVLKE